MIVGTPRQRRRKGAFTGFTSFLSSPKMLPNLAAWYDISDLSSLIYDGSNRVQLVADKSGNSAVNALVLNGVAGNYASSPDAPQLDIVGDIDLRAWVALNDWTPSSAQTLLSKYITTADQRSWYLVILTDGTVNFRNTTLGTAASAVDYISTAATGFSDFAQRWVRVTLDVDNGAGGKTATFYTSEDGNSWVQLGAGVTTAGTTSIFNSSAAVEIGSNNGGGSPSSGRILRAQIYNSIAGTLAFDANFTTQSKLATSFTESSVNAATVTINTTGDFGARISGARDLVNMTVADQPVLLQWSGTNYGYLNGVSGNYFSTPDAAPLDITGDIDLRAWVALNDWTPGTSNVVVCKDTTGAGGRSYSFRVLAAGTLLLLWSVDGTAALSATSTASVGASDFSQKWIRATLDVDNGAGGYTVTFYTSDDGSTWVQLGDAVVGGSTTSIANTTAVVEVGSTANGTNLLTSGKILRAQIYNGINGTLVFDFNPSAYVSGTTFVDSSVNAATITVNGGAVVVQRNALYFDGSNDVLKAAAFALSQPETVYFAGSQVTWTLNDALLDGNTSTSGRIAQSDTTPDIRLSAGTSIENSGFVLQNRSVVTGVINGAGSALRINRGSAVTGNAGAANMNGFNLGSDATPAAYGNITASEVVIYGAEHGLNFWNLVFFYLSRKWGFFG